MNGTGRKHLTDAAAGLFLIIVSVAVYIDAADIKIIARDRLDAAFFPRLLAVLIIILSLAVVARAVQGLRRERPGGKDGGAGGGQAGDLVPAAATLGLLGLYVFTIDILGFLLCTAGYIFAQAWIMAPPGGRRAGRIALLGVAASAGIYLIFKHGFRLMVPAGILG